MELTRRQIGRAALAMAAVSALPARAADDLVQLEWSDLVPNDGAGSTMEQLRSLGIVEHGQLSTPFDQEQGANVTHEFDGKTVRIPGYIVPLDYSGQGVTSFLLVPYVGACIHVPPPPANQLIMVTTEEPYESEGLFESVWVTGMFGASAVATELADIGYAISADRIEPYG
ncbi:hypothetical protein CLV78_104210 [Aliiruegeria haliotis]|uniref:DUF3299 domain-containing protein n=1 Tax=Aliiruegeria haliotis TaxID=1280846 RepID=A0A2T0RRC1_9RHOB|nr:DUF3299 domain-containing protein [Aliiruegeria haliotis]PRY23718.1 hypothetical protein CLV78_104210 [Aliiruegeria haliotis]